MQYIQVNNQVKADRLRNITITCQKFKNKPVYERGGKCIQCFLKNIRMHYHKMKVQ